ncbi:MAG: B12-binding domain-containing radical SAM protein [Thermoplasmata archaeon]|nr:B12-binding domain-containing radical SAM protein [Thermoplasmata archaeon]
MKILLIWPKGPVPFQENYSRNNLLFRLISNMIPHRQPTAFSILASLTPKKHQVKVIERGVEDINFDDDSDLVGITTVTCLANIAYEIADSFRRRGVPVVIGGWHASALPEEAKQHADAVVIGEAEETWPQLLKDAESGKLKPFYRPKRPVDISKLPSLYNVYPKELGLGIQATRGCIYGCRFCSITNMKYRKVYRKRPISDVIEEIRKTSKVFAFQDATLTIDLNYTKELFRNMIGLNKKFVAMGNIHILGRDEELLKLANEAGCIAWQIGFESICQKSLDSVGKKGNKVEKYPEWIKKIQDYGMAVEGSFIFGFDYDTLDIFNKTDEFVRKNNLKMAYANALTPYPGTPIYEQLEKEGRILTKDWSKYDGHNYVVFKPKNMTPEELLTNVRELEEGWHKILRSVGRIIKSINFGIYNFFDVMAIELGWRFNKVNPQG